MDDLTKQVKESYTGFCNACHKECPVVSKQEAKAKLTGISIKSAKQKARRAQQKCRDKIRDAFGLSDEDVRSVQMGESGADLVLSRKAREAWPFHAIEVSASPNASLMGKFQQAQRHGEKQLSGKVQGNGRPILLFKKNSDDLYALVLFDDLLAAIAEKKRHPVEKEKAA